MLFNYHWVREEQQKYAEDRLFKFIKKYVYCFHPYYRNVIKGAAIDADKINKYDDFRKIPVTERKDLASDPLAFILQTKIPSLAYDVEELSSLKKLVYSWQ